MSSALPPTLLRLAYYEAAQAYLRGLPPEHFMEATSQAMQRKITLESLDLVHARRPEVQVFNELLVQYPGRRGTRFGQVVPDNMVVVHDQPIQAEGSYDVPYQPVPPFWVLEYVSQKNHRKDYEQSFRKYERELKVKYYLVFYPDGQELTLFRHTGKKYVTVQPNAAERFPLAELDLEMGLLGGWVRYWYEGTLLPLPADLQRELDETRRLLRETTQRAEAEKQRAEAEKRRADAAQEARLALERELAELRAQLRPPRRPRKNS
jgi:Uma2 family endonuclease